MPEPLSGIDLSERIDLKELNGWGQDLGGDLIDGGSYKFVPKPVVERLPPGQKWTALNSSKSEELEKVSLEFEDQKRENHDVLTLQAVSIRHESFTDAHADRLWNEGHVDLAMAVDDGNSFEVTLALSTCKYFEHLAWFTGKVEGLENPNAILVSLQTVTADNKLVFARRNRVSAGENKIGVVGGVGEVDPIGSAYDEIKQELGVDESDASIRLITLMQDRYKRPVLFYRAIVNLTSDEIERNWTEKATDKNEHSELIFINFDYDGLVEFAKEHDPGEFHPPADLIFQQALLQKIREEEEREYMGMAGGGSSPI